MVREDQIGNKLLKLGNHYQQQRIRLMIMKTQLPKSKAQCNMKIMMLLVGSV